MIAAVAAPLLAAVSTAELVGALLMVALIGVRAVGLIKDHIQKLGKK